MLLNWGSVAIPSGNTSPNNCNFSLSYTSKCYQAVTDTKLNSGDGLKCIGVGSLSKTQITWDTRYVGDSGRSGTQRWLAIGV